MEYNVEGTLSFGTKMEVFYKLEKDDGSVEEVWWPASVKRLILVQDQRGTSMSGTISFSPLHAFPSSVSQVVFEKDFEIRDKDGIVYPWRISLQDALRTVSSSSASGGGAMENSDTEYTPGENQVELGKRKARLVSRGWLDEDGPHFKSQRKLYELERGIIGLRTEVEDQKRKLDLIEVVTHTTWTSG